MSDSDYELWADYYDIIHTGLPGEAEFYVGQAVRTNGTTLELGCGTGRICIPMAMSGVDVLGLDVSSAMLQFCKEKKRAIGDTRGRLWVVQADMRDFEFARQFELIVMPYRTFMHLLTSDDKSRCLERVHRHLVPGGTFIVNLWAAASAGAVLQLSPTPGTMTFADRYPLPGGEGHLLHYVASWCDAGRQIIDEEHLIHEIDEQDEVVSTVSLPMRRAWTTPPQMRELLEDAGFRVVALFGDFECARFTPESSEMIWVAQR